MKPLDSLRVIDASHRLAGRLAALLLADQGADVVRVHEQPEATPLDAVLNRNKRVLHATAGEDLQKLCAGADVIIADSDQAQSALNNRTAIRLTLPAFHPDDDMPAGGEGLAAAATGIYTDVSPAGALLGLPPIYTAIPMGNTYAAVFGATAVMAELLAQGDTGDTPAATQLMVPHLIVPHLIVPLASAAMAPMGSVLFGADPQPRRYDMPPLPRVVSRKILPLVRKWAQRSERLQARLRALGPKFYPPFANAYRCSDGEKIYVFTIDHRRLPLVLLRELGLLESAKAQGMTEADPYAPASNNNLLDPVNLSVKHKRWLAAEMARVLAGKTAVEWEVKLGSAGVPCSVLRSTEEWLTASEAFTAGLLTKVSDPQLGEIVQPGPHVWIDGADPGLSQPRPAQTVVAAEWVNERRSGSAKRFWRSGQLVGVVGQPVGGPGQLPLHGCLVLDLSAMIAGPISTRTLAELGAEVIKIDAPKPAHGPRMSCYYGLEVSHGKRSALLDLATPAGLAVLKRLAAQADVVVHNFTPPAMKKLGLDGLMSDPDYQHLTWARVSAFGGPKPGPWDARRGYDQVMQAATGIQVRYSDKAAPDLHGIASCVDYITGYLLTYAVMTALYCGQRQARVSLAQAAQFIQAPFMLAHPSHKADEPQGRMAKGIS